MNDLARHKNARKNKQRDFSPKGILDIIETDYPDRYVLMAEDGAPLENLFSAEEWLDILSKVRSSYEKRGLPVSPRYRDLP